DLRMNEKGEVYVLELNPLPGLTPDYSDLCFISQAAGMDYRTLIAEILAGGIKRLREKRREANGIPTKNGRALVPPNSSAAAPNPAAYGSRDSQPEAPPTAAAPSEEEAGNGKHEIGPATQRILGSLEEYVAAKRRRGRGQKDARA
ncbi:MAG TPA: hypothetical protein PKI03_23510, partial [Pseudomonadota bacterium]|nr:hypothetical protein [Pseudomonadota bacterium]